MVFAEEDAMEGPMEPSMDGPMEHPGMLTVMETKMVPFHFAQIGIYLLIAIYTLIIIRQTSQFGTFIYIFLAMVFFSISAMFSYSPHLGIISDNAAQIAGVILNTIALALI